MKQLFEQISEYQKALGYNHAQATQAERMERLRHYVLALQVEQAEFISTLPWKPWRSYQDNLVISDETVDEWTDCLVFLVDQALALNITAEDIAVSFERTMAKLKKRLQNGYHTEKGETAK